MVTLPNLRWPPAPVPAIVIVSLTGASTLLRMSKTPPARTEMFAVLLLVRPSELVSSWPPTSRLVL